MRAALPAKFLPIRRYRSCGSRKRPRWTKLACCCTSFAIHRIVAGISQPNPASVALHRRLGFREVGVFSNVGRKFGRYWDVAWFERPLRG